MENTRILNPMDSASDTLSRPTTRSRQDFDAHSIQDVAEELTLETVLDIWQSATDRLHQTHLTLQQEIRRLSDELEEKNRQLARKDRLADLGQMAAHVAHEVRNNLVPMTLYMSLLKRQLSQQSVSSHPAQDKSIELLGKIESGFESMKLMVGDLLNFTTDRQPEPRPLDAVAFADSLVQEVRLQCRAQQIVVSANVPAGTELHVDRDMMARAIRNLLINGVDAMQDGGELLLRIRCDGNQQILEVLDTGPGVPDHLSQRLFDPFVTTKDTGTGLGLSIVERIVEAHGGKICLHNQIPHGTRFQVTLPAVVTPHPIV